MPRFKAKDEDKSLYINFLKKAEEFMNAAKASLERQEYNAACSNAVHTVISGADALCVYFLGKRSSGDSHEESAGLFNSLPLTKDEKQNNSQRILRVISAKSMAEYESRLVLRKEAENAIKDAERFLSFVRKNLPNL